MKKLESIIVSSTEPKLHKGIAWFNPKAKVLKYFGSNGWDVMAEIPEEFDITSVLGQPGGAASLDDAGKVPSSQLPSYVDDVIEVDSFDSLPPAGEKGKIYVTVDDNKTYRWSGSTYVEISNPLNSTYASILKSIDDYGVLLATSPNFGSPYIVGNKDSYRLFLSTFNDFHSGTVGYKTVEFPLATTSKRGIMSSEDKTFIDFFKNTASNKNFIIGNSNQGNKLNFNTNSDNVYLNYSTASESTTASFNSATIPAATTEEAGVMTASDKSKLNSIEEDLYEDLVAGDIILVDNNTLKKTFCKLEKLEEYKETHTPIGVVVIPTNHDVYGTGEAGVISLTGMNVDTPDVGQISGDHNPCWGPSSIPGLKKYTVVASYGDFNAKTLQSELTEPHKYAALASDNITKGERDIICDWAQYPSSIGINDDFGYAPNPYLADGSRNPDYYDTTISTEFNALSDFDGYRNTQIMCEYQTGQPNWKTDDTIINKTTSGYAPAALTCLRYHTIGTQQGDWYFPALGELGYFNTKKKTINASVKAIKTIFKIGSNSIADYLQSSTDFTNSNARAVCVDARSCVYRQGSKSSDPWSLFAYTRIKIPKFYTKEEVDKKIEDIPEVDLSDIESKLEGVTKAADDSEVVKGILVDEGEDNSDESIAKPSKNGTVELRQGKGIIINKTGSTRNIIDILADTEYLITREEYNKSLEEIESLKETIDKLINIVNPNSNE